MSEKLSISQQPAERQCIEGRHAVRHALDEGRPLYKLYLLNGGDGLGVFRRLARERGVPVHECDRVRMDALSREANGGGLGVHQGVIAVAAAHSYAEPDDIWDRAEADGRPPLVVVCDGIEDPRNLGALIRTAEAAGAHGVVVRERRGAGLTAACVKAAAGALEYLPVARVPGIPAFLESCKRRGVWVYGADTGEGARPMRDVDFSGGVVLVLGGEGQGLGRLTRERCDMLVSIPMYGKTPSLNVSAAAAVLLFEIARHF
ncbi:MAG: 23S rRNA (guanosine(2251)-2'-O)-methyltransferase RlmB [Oscillospiraceae bacterium]|nr:23S rRNA (guanosine(2251)-2'-O)-methyltransferase RlmB [Oscillospiraceae bacterium]